MTKREARNFNEGFKGYQFAYLEDGFIFFQKRIHATKYSLIKLLEIDLMDGSYKIMFDKEITRI